MCWLACLFDRRSEQYGRLSASVCVWNLELLRLGFFLFRYEVQCVRRSAPTHHHTPKIVGVVISSLFSGVKPCGGSRCYGSSCSRSISRIMHDSRLHESAWNFLEAFRLALAPVRCGLRALSCGNVRHREVAWRSCTAVEELEGSYSNGILAIIIISNAHFSQQVIPIVRGFEGSDDPPLPLPNELRWAGSDPVIGPTFAFLGAEAENLARAYVPRTISPYTKFWVSNWDGGTPVNISRKGWLEPAIDRYLEVSAPGTSLPSPY